MCCGLLWIADNMTLSISPSIPETPRGTGRKRSRGSGSCLLDCLCDCGRCLLGCFFKIVFSILITIGLIILVLWLIMRPHHLKFKATNATLTTFNFNVDNTNNLNFNLAVNLAVLNPNQHVGIYYDDIQADVIYGGQRLKTIKAMTFYQGHKNTTAFQPLVFKGQNMVSLGSYEKFEFDEQSKNGVYEIEMKLHMRVRFKVGLLKTWTSKPKVKCDLKVPLVGKSSRKFEETTCQYYF